jgi:hypothetical protein
MADFAPEDPPCLPIRTEEKIEEKRTMKDNAEQKQR